MNKRVVLVFLLVFVISKSYSQPKQFSSAFPSPNVVSLGNHTEMPVSFFTGLPNIDIPLYEVRGRHISLPISLSYHAGGLRPDNHPGWVGNGWALRAGGSITRKINGAIGGIDEYNKPAIGKTGWYYNYSNLTAVDWSATSRLQVSGTSYFNVDGIPPGQLQDSDTEPDEFIFSFGEYSGKFMLDQTGTWQVQCDRPLKVVFDPLDFVDPFVKNISALNISNNINKTFGKFTIFDEYGNKYIFGGTDPYNSAIEFSDVMIPASIGRGGSITATSWMLTKIISADGTEYIDLAYERGPLVSSIGFGQGYTAIDATGSGTFMTMDPPCQHGPNYFGLSGSVIFPVYLSSISMPSRNILIDFSAKSQTTELKYLWNGTNVDAYAKVWDDAGAIPPTGAPAEFPSFYLDIVDGSIIPWFATNTPSTSRWERFIWLKLDAMKVRDWTNGSLIREFGFTYNNNINKRLQLNSLSFKNAGSQVVSNYIFGYNTATSLPDYIKIYGDHWGFNNINAGGVNNLLPHSGGTSSTDYLTLRAPDVTGVQTKAEVLTSITYPTGGVTTFDYQPNTYSEAVERNTGNGVTPVAVSGVGGGLRVWKITSTDNLGNSMSKEYYYVKNYTAGANPALLTSSGILDSKPKYLHNNSGIDNSGFTVYYQSNSSHGIVPLTTNSAGTHIGYSEVVERRTDGSFTIYNYSNHDNALYRDQTYINSFNTWALGYSPIISNSYKRGKLLQRIDKTNTGTTVAEETTTYSSCGPASLVNAVYSYWFNTCPASSAYRRVRTRVAYQFAIQSFLPASVVKRTYPLGAGGTPVEQTASTNFDNYRNLISQGSTDSKGTTQSTMMKYAYHFTDGQDDNPYQQMVNMNNVSSVVEKTVMTGNNVKAKVVNTYRMLGPGKIYQDAVYTFESAEPVFYQNVLSSTYDNGGNLTMDARLKLQSRVYYDPSGNVSTIDSHGKLLSYLWNYNKQFPVAQVVDANNIYASGALGNVDLQPSVTKFLGGNPPFTANNYSIAVERTGNVTLFFKYMNEFIAGNNSTSLLVSLTSAGYNSSITICAKTNQYPGGCTNNSHTFTNVPPGNYTVTATISSQVGFQNYYGYSLVIGYPSYQYEVIGANSSVAYTSFETTVDHGNWTNVVDNNRSGSALTGDWAYTITSAPVTGNNLVAAKSYIVSYWKNGAACNVTGSQSVKTGRSYAGYTYYEHTVKGVTSTVVSGTGKIDELRLYPAGSQMNTYTYDPVLGMKSQCDANNRIISYMYDSFGRLYLVRDQDGNVIKKICYNYAGVPESCN
jgi:YD repeat-containing protein